MLKTLTILLLFCFGWAIQVFGQWHVVITDIPEQTPENNSIYIAGNFNQWNPGHPAYKLSKDSMGRWNILLSVNPGKQEFKFTRGSWATVEGTEEGKVIGNRIYQYPGGPQTTNYVISGWEDLSGQGSSTASPQVSIMSQSFPMPQLNTTRKIWMYLPKDYYTSNKTYPVIYMHDGQNLFDNATSYAGEWKVDEALDSLYNAGDYGCIVIGIENGGVSRIQEYTPWPNASYGGGKGDLYMKFIVETLKPHVDAKYRTKKEARYTAIAGSSLGGFISHYGGIAYANSFGKVGSLSTSYWFSPNIYSIVTSRGVGEDSHYFMSAGTSESTTLISDLNRMVDTLRSAGIKEDNLKTLVIQGGKHDEKQWVRVFPVMYQWFWSEEVLTSTINHGKFNDVFHIIRQGDSVMVQGEIEEGFSFQMMTLDGKNITSGVLQPWVTVPPALGYQPLVFTVLFQGKVVQSVKLL